MNFGWKPFIKNKYVEKNSFEKLQFITCSQNPSGALIQK